MPVKMRSAKIRQHRITPEAVEAWGRGDWIGLHRALGLRPWQPSPLDANTPDPPSWAGPRDAWRESWGLARELRSALESAVKDAE